MACNAQQTLVFNGIKGKQIDIDKIPILPVSPDVPSLNTWYNNANENIQYSVEVGNGIYITYNLNVAPAIGCNKNPVELCDPCITVTGTITDLQINDALAKLPFKSSNMGLIIAAGIGIAVLYLTLKKK